MKPDIVIATPGRLIDHLHNSPNFSLRNIEILVLDEADRYNINCFIFYVFSIFNIIQSYRISGGS